LKKRGTVIDVADPKEFGRIKVQLIGYDSGGNFTPWCWPCSPFAGPGYGFYCLPVVGDEVYVENTEDGRWVWSGFCWTERNAKPADGTADVRVMRTPVGHQLKLDENGDVEIEHSGGSKITIKQNGDIELSAPDGKILMNSSCLARGVNTLSICSFTGLPHPQGSRSVYTEEP
jgi:uncharacterized protein involved in type VI secretion and phage assembly